MTTSRSSNDPWPNLIQFLQSHRGDSCFWDAVENACATAADRLEQRAQALTAMGETLAAEDPSGTLPGAARRLAARSQELFQLSLLAQLVSIAAAGQTDA